MTDQIGLQYLVHNKEASGPEKIDGMFEKYQAQVRHSSEHEGGVLYISVVDIIVGDGDVCAYGYR
tara:strand:+ start:1214 stop:1408 length:195 start_codon:yes stop_codon:yes gene_type:complete